MRLIVCPWSFQILFVATVSQGDPWSSTREPPCCVRVGSRWFPSTQPPLFAAPWYQAASAQPGCRSGVKLKRTLQTFIQTCLKLSSSGQTQGDVGVAFYRRRELRVRCAASASRSSAEAASSVLSISLESWIARAWEEPTLPHDIIPIQTICGWCRPKNVLTYHVNMKT